MMKAVSADKEVLELLYGAKMKGTVHSVFDRVVNISWGESLIAVCVEKTEPAPDSLITDYAGMFDRRDFSSGMKCVVENNRLSVGELWIDMKDCHVYKLSLPEKFSVPYDVITRMLDKTERLVRIYGARSPLYTAYFGREGSDEMERLCALSLKDISMATATNNRSTIAHSIFGMMGLGIGLTPSGDDFISGMSLILTSYDTTFKSTLADEFAGCKHTTGVISRQMIGNSICGKARLSELKLANAYMTGDEGSVKNYVHQVLRYGATSGTDAMCGIMYGLRYIISEEKRKRHE